MSVVKSVRGRTTRRIPDTERQFMWELRQRGLTVAEVARETGYSYSATGRILQDMKLQQAKEPQRVRFEVVPAQHQQPSATGEGADELHSVMSLLNTIEEVGGKAAREQAVEAMSMHLFTVLQRLMFPNLSK